MSWNLSCPDWAERLASGRSLVPDLPLDLVQGDRAVAVFNRLRLADVPGTPTMAEAGGEWFRDVVRALFGSLDPVTRARMIRELFMLVPKKNSKTTNGALLMLVALLLNERPNAPMGMAAPVQDVAEVAFNAIAGAIDLDPVLDKKLHVRHHLKRIVHRETKATLEIMTFDPAALTGPKWVAFLLDELHVIAKMAKAASALRQIKGGMLPYPEAFLATITTQSDEPPVGIFAAELRKARAVRDGTLEGAMLPVLYEFPVEIQRKPKDGKPERWRDPALWPMVTPNAGRSITIGRLIEEFRSAEASGDDELRGWASQHLNIEIGLALHASRWSGADFWEQNAVDGLTLKEVLRRSEVVTIGIDGGGLDDMLGLAVLGREEGTGTWLLWTRAWIHPIAVKRRESEESRYLDFKKDGDLWILDPDWVPSDPSRTRGEDITAVGDIVEECEKAGLLDRIGVDTAGIGDIPDEIEDRKIERERVVGIPQGWKLVGVIKNTERRLESGGLQHGGSALMNWCVGNAKIEQAGNAVLITKKAAGFAKIDPLMATLNAAALMSMNPKPRRKKFQFFLV